MRPATTTMIAGCTAAFTMRPARKKWQTVPWPHPMTYVLALFSPALAAVALYVSWSSLSLSREALR
jgi:hypothetical protein